MVMNDMNLNASKLYSLSWSEFSSSLSVAAQSLRHQADLIDVTISAGGKHFPAHKLVLSAASPLLMDLLKSTTCQHPILMLAGISAFDLETILDFVYHGEINIRADKLPSLLQAAQLLDIRALSPAALVLNSLDSAIPTRITDKDASINNHDTLSEDNENFEGEKSDSKVFSQKRKITHLLNSFQDNDDDDDDNSDDHTPLPDNKNITKILKKSLENVDTCQAPQKSSLQHKPNQFFTKGEGSVVSDEKKIISDLPVKCKLCGVTIRQSRNLRRHMDQMHSKAKTYRNEDNKNQKNNNGKIISKSSNNKSDLAASFLDFSDDSFNRFTEEIFNCSSMPDASINSFCSSLSTSSVDENLIEDIIQTPSNSSSASATQPTLLYTLSGGSVSQTLNTILGDICFQPPTTTVSTSSDIPLSEKKSVTSSSRFLNENYEFNNSESDCCDSGDNAQDIVTFKELDNQLLSACFCSNGDDG